jgi:hypothetical protein
MVDCQRQNPFRFGFARNAGSGKPYPGFG